MRNFEEDKRFVEELASEVKTHGGAVYYVGGYVRDQILGKDNKDIDIEVHGVSQECLKEILLKFGEVTEQGASFGILKCKGHSEIDIAQPRYERKTGDKHTDFEVIVDPFMGIKEAMKRRDFTINAVYQDVLTGELFDEFNGIKDLKEGVIRHVNDSTFIEDPLRVLRAAQFAARFGFTVADETLVLMSKMDLSHISRERINEELKKGMMKSDKPSVFFNTLKEVNQLRHWFPEVDALIGCPQNVNFHPEGDVYNHTMLVLDKAATYRDKAEHPYEFMVAALCHDFGKPLTLEFNEKKGVYQSLEHEIAGVEPAKEFCDRVIHNNKLKDYVLDMVEHHDRPLMLYSGKSKPKKTNVMYDQSICPNDLIYLTLSDKHGYTEEQTADYEKWLRERLDKYKERMQHPEVTGDDLIELGLKPGKEFKEILCDTHHRFLSYEDKEQLIKSVITMYCNTKEEDEIGDNNETEESIEEEER